MFDTVSRPKCHSRKDETTKLIRYYKSVAVIGSSSNKITNSLAAMI